MLQEFILYLQFFDQTTPHMSTQKASMLTEINNLLYANLAYNIVNKDREKQCQK